MLNDAMDFKVLVTCCYLSRQQRARQIGQVAAPAAAGGGAALSVSTARSPSGGTIGRAERTLHAHHFTSRTSSAAGNGRSRNLALVHTYSILHLVFPSRKPSEIKQFNSASGR